MIDDKVFKLDCHKRGSRDLQAVQNAAARIVMMRHEEDEINVPITLSVFRDKDVVRQRKRAHITPTLRQLHWLPVHGRILHKLLSVTYRSVHENRPLSINLSELIPPYTPSRSLRWVSESLLGVLGPKDCKAK